MRSIHAIRRRLLGALLALVSFTFLGMVCTAQAGAVLDALKARGALRVGTTGDYKPFSFRDADGQYRGADIEMAEDLARSLGVAVVFVPTTWAHLLDDFAAEKFDIAVGGITITPDRAEKGLFSRPLMADGKRPIARCAEQDRFTTLASIDRPQTRVIVNPGGTNEAFAHAHFPHAQLTVHRDNASVFAEIAEGRADVMVTDGIEADHQAALLKTLCAVKVSEPFTRFEKAYLLQHDFDLKSRVDAWLSEAQGSGRWQKILDRALAAP